MWRLVHKIAKLVGHSLRGPILSDGLGRQMHTYRIPLIVLKAWFALVLATSVASADELRTPLPTAAELLGYSIEEEAHCAEWDFRQKLIHVDRDQYTLSLAGSFLDTRRVKWVEYGSEACPHWTCDEIRVTVNTGAVKGVEFIEAENVRTGRILRGEIRYGDTPTERVTVQLSKSLFETTQRDEITPEDKFYIRFVAAGGDERFCAREYTKEELAANVARERLIENCVTVKSRLSFDKAKVRSKCREIAEDPSWFQKWRWGG